MESEKFFGNRGNSEAREKCIIASREDGCPCIWSEKMRRTL